MGSAGDLRTHKSGLRVEGIRIDLFEIIAPGVGQIVDEIYTDETVDINGKEAKVTVARYNGKVLRVIPNDEISRNSGLTRDELFALVK